MAVLTTKQRKALPKSSFVFPGKRAYPINALAHARNAFARVAQHGTPSQQRRVRTAVNKKFPSLRKSRKG